MKCIVATGEAHSKNENGPHAWNILNIDGVPYQMDVTWDIGMMNKQRKILPYDYFLISDELSNLEHLSDNKLPICNSMDLNYFTKSELLFKSKSRLLAYVGKELLLGRKEFYFRITGRVNQEEVIREVSSIITTALLEKGKKNVKIQQGKNEKIGTCWIKAV